MIDSAWDESWLDVGHNELNLRFDTAVLSYGPHNYPHEFSSERTVLDVVAKKRKISETCPPDKLVFYPDEPLHYKHKLPGYGERPAGRNRLNYNNNALKPLPPSPDSYGVNSPESNTSDHELNTQQLVEQYLSFEDSNPNSCLVDDSGNAVHTTLQAHLSGNWHLTNGNKHLVEEGNSTKQLTFYRRNLFDLRTSCSFDSKPTYVVDGNDTKTLVDSLVLAVELYSSSSKRKDATVVGRSGAPVFDRVLKVDKGELRVVEQEWTKVKFSSATVNNGAPCCQPYFQVVVVLRAISCTGVTVPVLKASSQPIVVRGRHPRFYKDRFGISLASTDVKRKSSVGEDSLSPPAQTESTRMSGANKTSSAAAIDSTRSSRRVRAVLPTPQTPLLDDLYGRAESNDYYYFPLDRVTPDEMVEGFYNPHFPHQALSDLRQPHQKGLSYYRSNEEEEWNYEDEAGATTEGLN